jgi:hypothetical protein
MAQTITAPAEVVERQPPTELFRHLRSTPHGLRSREAARRLTGDGVNDASALRHADIGTAALGVAELLFLAPSPLAVWGADEIFRALVRRRGADVTKEAPSCESATS